MADSAQVKELTEKLEQGVKDIFGSDAYAAYLKTMSRFHYYSTRNTMLIHLQMPKATLVAGFQAWQNKFARYVKKGEKSIKILAPVPFTKSEEKEKLDPDTRRPIIGEDGTPVMEYTERKFTRFKVTSVFDVSQTDGKPLPALAQDLSGNVEQYEAFMDALRAVSPLPVVFEHLPDNTDGVCRFGEEIAIREGMSEIQTVSALVHEIAHARLHDLESLRLEDGKAQPKDSRTEEVEAESVSFCVNSFFSIETGANSFGYVAAWSRGRELKELKESLDTIRKASSELIDAIDGKFREIVKERGIDLTAKAAAGEQEHAAQEIQAAEREEGEIIAQQNYSITDGDTDNEPPDSGKIPAGDRDLTANIQGYIQSVGKVMDITDAEIYQTVLRMRSEGKSNDYRDIAELMLNGRALAEHRQREAFREQIIALSGAETPDAKYEIAQKILADALCADKELLALAATGAKWRNGEGRKAVYDDGRYEKLVQAFSFEFADLLADKMLSNKLRNTVTGEVYRRLDEIAYDRFILDEYAETAKSGRLETYETPCPEDSENTGVLVHLTERTLEGGIHDYGEIFSYNPDDHRNHAINNYLSFKAFSALRESVFGKTESAVTLNYKETEPVGSTVLRRLLFTDMNFNREQKRTRVEVLPPLGKYSVYAQHLPGASGDDDILIHIGTDSGYLYPLGVSKTRFDEYFAESQIDRIFEQANAGLDAALSDPGKFADYRQAAITGRFSEVEAHNVVYKQIRAEIDRERSEEISAQQAASKKEAQGRHIEQLEANAGIIADGGNFKIEPMQFTGRNNLLELFALYDIDVPLATKGWFNNKLVSFEVSASGGFSYRSYQNKGRRTSYMGNTAAIKLTELRAAVQATPALDKLIEKGLAEKPEPEQEKNESANENTIPDKEVSDIQPARDDIQAALDAFAEKHGFGRLTAEFYSETRTKNEPQNVIVREGAEQRELLRSTLFEFSKGAKITAEHLSAYFARLETSKAVLVAGHDDLTLYDIDVIKARRDFQVRERQTKLGRDKDLPLPAVRDRAVGDTVLIYRPENRNCAYMKVAAIDKKSVVLQSISNSFYQAKISLERFKSEQGFNIAEEKAVGEKGRPATVDSGEPPKPKPEKKYDIGCGHFGNGLSVWNRAEEENGDYKTVAHIGPDRAVTFYDKEMPETVKNRILEMARTREMTVSATQNTPVFHAPPQNASAQETAVPAAEPEKPKADAPDIPLPDPLTSVAARNEYGYTYDGMLPVSALRAAELFDTNHCVYLLHPDNTESMAYDCDEILAHNDLCGIERGDWEKSPVCAAQMAASAEHSLESDLLHGGSNKFGIYQIRDDLEEKRDFRFAPLRELEALGLAVSRSNYKLVYTAPLDIHDRMSNLNRIFERFQHDSPECPHDFTEHSVSVSDVIVLQWRGEVSAHFVDSFGFKELPSFTGNEHESAPDQTLLQTEIRAGKRNMEQSGGAKTPAPDTLSQVGTRPDEYAGKTTAELESEVKAGKVISLLDLSKAVNAERNSRREIPKTKKSTLMERLAEGKRKAAAQGVQKPAPQRDPEEARE